MSTVFVSTRDDVKDAVNRILTAQTGDGAKDVRVQLNDVATSFAPSLGFSGIALSTDTLQGCAALTGLLLSPEVAPMFGLVNSTFLIPSSDVDTDLKKLRLECDKDQVHSHANAFVNIMKSQGSDGKNAMCHIGAVETMLPIADSVSSSSDANKLGVCIRSVSQKHHERCHALCQELHDACNKGLYAKEETATAATPELSEDAHALLAEAMADVNDLLNGFANACIEATKASIGQQEHAVYSLTDRLGLSAMATKRTKQKFYPTYSMPLNTVHAYRTQKDEPLGVFSCYIGAVPESRDSVTGTSVCMFHSPAQGSVVYSMHPETVASVIESPIVGGGTPRFFATVCARNAATYSSSSKNVGIAQDPLGMQNRHISLDAESSTYQPLLACPHLYSRAFFENGHLIRIGSEIALFGNPVDYARMPPLENIQTLGKFIESLDERHIDGANSSSVYVPDSKGNIARLITNALPETFFDVLSRENAVRCEKNGTLRGWNIDKDVLCTLLEKHRDA